MVKEKILVDASFLISLISEKDQWHNDAVKLVDTLKNSEKIITMPMVIETINLIGKCQGGKIGYKIYNYIKSNFIIVNYDNLIDDAMFYFLKYDGTLSLADSTAVHVMKENKIIKILSFDSDFDKVDGIVRIF